MWDGAKLQLNTPDRALVELWIESELETLRGRNDDRGLSIEETQYIRGAIACCKQLRTDLLLEKRTVRFMSELPGDY